MHIFKGISAGLQSSLVLGASCWPCQPVSAKSLKSDTAKYIHHLHQHPTCDYPERFLSRVATLSGGRFVLKYQDDVIERMYMMERARVAILGHGV